MGFSGFPATSAGIFPVLVVNTAMSIAAFKDAFSSILQVIGLRREAGTSVREPLELQPQEDFGWASGHLLPTLAEEIRAALPIRRYDQVLYSDFSMEVSQCVVCLSDLESEHEILDLPYCSHAFHKACLDKWLDHRQTTCPLCRSSLMPKGVARKLRQREQELSEELMLWFSSFHGADFEGLWWES
eukprot:c4601_g1_i1 orf=664-1221(-)